MTLKILSLFKKEMRFVLNVVQFTLKLRDLFSEVSFVNLI